MSDGKNVALRNARRTLDNAIIDLSDEMDAENLKGKVWNIVWFLKCGRHLQDITRHDTETLANDRAKAIYDKVAPEKRARTPILDLLPKETRYWSEISHWVPIPVNLS